MNKAQRIPARRPPAAGVPTAEAFQRAALAVSSVAGPNVFGDLVQSLASILAIDVAFVAVFRDDDPSQMRTLAAWLDGKPLRNFDYVLAGSPCESVVGREFRYVPHGVAGEIRADTIFAATGMDSYAAYPLNDADGEPVGLLVTMRRTPIEAPELAEAVLKTFAVRIAAEIERARTEDALRRAALAVSSAKGDAVFRELVRDLASILGVDMVFIAHPKDDDPTVLHTLAVCLDGRTSESFAYPLSGTPCETIVGQQYRAYLSGLRERFPNDTDFAAHRFESYAGFPLMDTRGAPLGLISVVSRKPLSHPALVESILKIFAVRAAAEIERLRADEALRVSEANYRAIFEAAEDAIFIHDPDTGVILDVNPKACATYGYTCEEMRRLTVDDLSSGVPPYAAGDGLRRIEEAKQKGAVQFEWHRRNRDGSLRWDEVRLKRAMIGGRPRVLAFTRDITERKLAEEQLRASEEQYRAIFNASEDALILWDSAFKRVDVNPAYERVFGWARGEVIGRGYEGMPRPQDYAETRLALVQRGLAGERCHVELESVRKGGERFDAEVHTIPIQYRGEPHVLAIVRDVTERRRAEAAIRASEEQYRAIFNASIDGMIIGDLDGTVVDVNPALLAMYGYSRANLVGQSPSPIIPEESIGAFREFLAEVGAGRVFRIESLGQHSDGSRLLVEVHGSPVTYQGRPHLLAVIRDITARKRAEGERIALEAQLRQAQKMEAIGHLTGGIAHDFNNILTSVMGYVGLAAERDSASADTKLGGYLEQALRSCRRARDLIQQMLVFSRGRRGDRRPTDLAPIVEESSRLLRSTLPATLRLATVRDARVPHVRADAVQAEQVLLNLAINARDAMDGRGTLSIGLHCREVASGVCASCRKPVSGRFVELAVSDTGAGIPVEVMDRMFEPFFSTKEVGKGSGMGLATVHGIVHDHGGHVLVHSAPGRGTTFRVLLPVLDGVRESSEAATGAGESPRPRPRLQGRVLVVDDEASVAAFMQELLAGWGLDVTAAVEPRDALDRISREPHAFGLVITDLTMPGMTGLQLARAIAGINPAVPVVLSTGYSEGVTDDALRGANVRALLRKPIETGALRDLLDGELASIRSGATSRS